MWVFFIFFKGNAWNKQIESKGSSQEVGEQLYLAVGKEVLLESAFLKIILNLFVVLQTHKESLSKEITDFAIIKQSLRYIPLEPQPLGPQPLEKQRGKWWS